jgi:RNA polymerase sigma-70 factor (ECF subfamily)
MPKQEDNRENSSDRPNHLAERSKTYKYVLDPNLRQYILRIIYSIIEDKDESLDVFQDTYLKLIKNLEKIRNYDKPYSYITSIARNTAITRKSYIKRDYSELKKTSSYFDYLEHEIAYPSGFSNSQIVILELLRSLRVFIRQLPQKQRQHMRLKYIAGYSNKEIANHLGCSASTVRTNLYYAKRNLRALIRNHFYKLGLFLGRPFNDIARIST